MTEHPPAQPDWRDRDLRFTLVVSRQDGYYRAQAAWADNEEVIAACDAPRPADSLAGATSALVNALGRLDFTSGIEAAIKRLGAPPS